LDELSGKPPTNRSNLRPSTRADSAIARKEKVLQISAAAKKERTSGNPNTKQRRRLRLKLAAERGAEKKRADKFKGEKPE
jgi:hypothetical protein